MKSESSALVQAEGISKTYRLPGGDRVEALRDVSVSIPEGSCVVVEGPSGCGKSTLLGLLGCLDHPSAGHVFYRGEEVTGYSEEELCRIRRGKIGFVFQDFRLLGRMSAWENVSVPLIPWGVSESGRFERASGLLDRLGLHDRILHRPEELSGGEQQRVCLARALINDPELVLADEPTSSIDAASAAMVLRMLDGVKSRGGTVVIATHDLNLFRKQGSGDPLCEPDSLYRLADGRIVHS